jgi:glycosyltransferase involved in cell wall biosynthesis
MKRKICWIIPTLDEGGAEKQLCLLAQAIDRNRFEPLVITLSRSGPRKVALDNAGVPVIEINKRGKLDLFAWFRLTKAIQNFSPDIVHTWVFAANSYGRAAALRCKVPIVFGGERCVDPWKTLFHNVIDRYLAKRTHGIITNSQGVVDFYAQRGIDPQKIFVIPNGIGPSDAPAISRLEACNRMGVAPDRFLIGTVGRLWMQKGHKDMIWAGEMARVLQEKTNLVIVGDGPEREHLEHYRDQVRASSVRFLGHRSDATQLIPHFDLYWNASHYEGQSNSILEAMLAKVPVIASDIAGNRDLVQHDQTGLLFPVSDVGSLMKLTARLIESKAWRERLAHNAFDRITNEFSIAKMVARHEELYSHVDVAS